MAISCSQVPSIKVIATSFHSSQGQLWGFFSQVTRTADPGLAMTRWAVSLRGICGLVM